jgi:Asp/Glu/hydantoin racemase
MSNTLAFIHTSHVLIPAFSDLARQQLPGVQFFHMVDESLIRNTIQAGHLSKKTIQRLAGMIGLAHEGGADAVMVTCSSIGPAIPVAREMYDFPVLRVDEAMAERAVGLGNRIGVAATLKTTLEPTVGLLYTKAAEASRNVEVEECLCAGAFERVLAGDTETHDRIVSQAISDLAGKVDAIVLAQASMARVVQHLDPKTRKTPILSSPELAVQQARTVLCAA